MFCGPTLAMVMVVKCVSRAPKDTELARAKRQVAAHGRDGGEDANEGTGLLGDHDGSDELVCVTVSVCLYDRATARIHVPLVVLTRGNTNAPFAFWISWDPDYRTTGAKVMLARPGASSSTSSRQVLAAGVI